MSQKKIKIRHESFEAARQYLGVNRRELALLLDISESYMYKMLSGKRFISDKLVIALAQLVEREMNNRIEKNLKP